MYGSVFGFYVSIIESLFNLLILKRKSKIEYNLKEISILSVFIQILNPTVFNSENILGFISATTISYLPLLRVIFLMHRQA